MSSRVQVLSRVSSLQAPVAQSWICCGTSWCPLSRLWPVCAARFFAVDLLQPIKDSYGDDLSADLIIIAGTTALEQMGGCSVGMCLGRTDDDDGSGSEDLDENIYLDAEYATAEEIKESMAIMGFSNREMTVLNGGGHAIGKAHWHKSGFEGKWTLNPTTLSNSFFTTLLNNNWVETNVSETGKRQFTDEAGNGLTMLSTDVAFKTDSEFSSFVQEYAEDNELFLTDFAAAWEKLINANRFGNACNGYYLSTISTTNSITISTTISAGNNETSLAASLRGTCLLIVLCFFGAGDRNVVVMFVPGARPLISGRIHFEEAIAGVTARPRWQPA